MCVYVCEPRITTPLPPPDYVTTSLSSKMSHSLQLFLSKSNLFDSKITSVQILTTVNYANCPTLDDLKICNTQKTHF